MRVAGAKRCFRLVHGTTRRRAMRPNDPEAAQLAASAVERAGAKGPIRATCLAQCLVLYAILRSRGNSPQVHLGADIRSGVMGAHAWLTLDGVPLGAGPSGFSDFPGAHAALLSISEGAD